MKQNYWLETLGRRQSRRRVLAGTGGALTAAAFLAACGGGSDKSDPKQASLLTKPTDTSKQARTGGTEKYYSESDPNNFDVGVSAAPLSRAYQMVYSTLVGVVPGHLQPADVGQIGPELAESWEWTPDNLQLTLKLRNNVVWHNKAPINGRAFDKDDVLFTWNWFATTSRTRSELVNSVNPEAPILSFTMSDARTIVIKLKEPLSYLMGLLGPRFSGGLVMVPKETGTTFDLRRDMIGTGPYMLANYTPSVGMTFKRNEKYFESGPPYIDQIDAPIVSEYATQLAQLKAGNIYTLQPVHDVGNTGVRPEDVLSVKAESPSMVMYEHVPFSRASAGDMLSFGAMGATGKAFQDVRVRRALSMSQDRDQYIDTFNNISQFEKSGVKLQTAWHTAIGPLAGWILDPKGKEFGPNAQYFKYDVAEAKKLLAAAGFPNGLEVTSSYVGGPERGASYQREPLVTDEFAAQAGFRVKTNLVDYNTVYIPKIRDGRGDWEGWAYKGGQPAADGAVAYMVFRYSKAGVGFLGFDANGPAGPSSAGDPQVEAMIAKAKTELDLNKQKTLVNDLQRHLAGQMYGLPYPGSASKLGLTWPALKNVEVFQYSKRSAHYYWWLDDTQAPLRKA